MHKSPLRKVSKKQEARLKEWEKVCLELREEQIKKRGFVYCEICMLPERPGEMFKVWGHHLDHNRSNNLKSNCLLAHWVCHAYKHHAGDKPFKKEER